MQFVDIQNAVIADLLDETDRTTVKTVINARANLLWTYDEWDFRRNQANVTVTVGSSQVTNLPVDFDVCVDLFRDDGYELKMYEEYREFAGIYMGTDNAYAGPPEAVTELQGGLIVGPVPNTSSSSYLLVYERAWTDLVNDSDVPAFPTDAHVALVFAAKADMCILKNVLLNEPLEQRYQEYLAAMQREYVTRVRGEAQQIPAYRPGGDFAGTGWWPE